MAFGPFFKPKPKRGRPTKSEAELKAEAVRRAQAAARKAALEDLNLQIALVDATNKLKAAQASADKLTPDPLDQVAAYIAKLQALGLMPKKPLHNAEDTEVLKELIRSAVPVIPQLLAQMGALKNTAHLYQPDPPAPALALPVPSPVRLTQEPPAATPPAPAAAQAPTAPANVFDSALIGVFTKRSPEDSAGWLYAQRTRWDAVDGFVRSLVGLPESQIPAYIDSIRPHVPATVDWIRQHPDWLARAVTALRIRTVAEQQGPAQA